MTGTLKQHKPTSKTIMHEHFGVLVDKNICKKIHCLICRPMRYRWHKTTCCICIVVFCFVLFCFVLREKLKLGCHQQPGKVDWCCICTKLLPVFKVTKNVLFYYLRDFPCTSVLCTNKMPTFQAILCVFTFQANPHKFN